MIYSKQARLIEKAYEILDGLTPLKTDCGELCEARCCGGSDKSGMWVFPGEEELLRDTGLTFYNAEDQIVVCDGICRRDMRPLSCRIFPLFPIAIQRINSIKIIAAPDPRALCVCPLFRDGTEITPEFKKAVERVGKLLLTDRKMRKYMLSRADFLRYLYTVKDKIDG